MKGIAKFGRPGSLVKAKSRKRKIDIKKPKSAATDWDKHIQTGIQYKAPTAVFRKDLGQYVSSTGYAFEEKPEGFKFLGERGSKFGIKRAGSARVPNTIGGKTKGIPKPMVFKSFSDYYVKEKLKGETDNYNIQKTDSGIITAIKAKPKEYRSYYKRSSSGKKKKNYSKYIPHEVEFTEEGKLLKDIKRSTYTKEYDKSSSGSQYTKKAVYVQDEKLYNNGKLASEIFRDTYDAKDERDDDGGREEEEKVYDKVTKLYEAGKIKKMIKRDDYTSYYENSGGDREEEESVYVEDEIDYDVKTGDILARKTYDTAIDKYKVSSSGKSRKYYQPFLERLYDYKGGMVYQYGPDAPDIRISKPPKVESGSYVLGADGKKYPVPKGSSWKPASGGTYVENVEKHGTDFWVDEENIKGKYGGYILDVKKLPKVEVEEKTYYKL